MRWASQSNAVLRGQSDKDKPLKTHPNKTTKKSQELSIPGLPGVLWDCESCDCQKVQKGWTFLKKKKDNKENMDCITWEEHLLGLAYYKKTMVF